MMSWRGTRAVVKSACRVRGGSETNVTALKACSGRFVALCAGNDAGWELVSAYGEKILYICPQHGPRHRETDSEL